MLVFIIIIIIILHFAGCLTLICMTKNRVFNISCFIAPVPHAHPPTHTHTTYSRNSNLPSQSVHYQNKIQSAKHINLKSP